MARELQNTTGSNVAVSWRAKPRELMKALLSVQTEHHRWKSRLRSTDDCALIEGSWRDPAKNLKLARRFREKVPFTLSELERTRDKFREWSIVGCTEDQLNILFAILCDGIPNGQIASERGFLDALVLSVLHENDKRGGPNLGGFGSTPRISPYATAAAINSLWIGSKFVPNVAEVVAACRKARDDLDKAVDVIHELRDRLDNAEAVLICAGELDDYTDRSKDGAAMRAEFQALQAKRLASPQTQNKENDHG